MKFNIGTFMIWAHQEVYLIVHRDLKKKLYKKLCLKSHNIDDWTIQSVEWTPDLYPI